MIKRTLAELAQKMGYLCHNGDACYIQRLVLDSRQVVPGDGFIAVAGSEQDGHSFIEEALAKGATGIISIGRKDYVFPEKIPCLRADSLEEFLGRLARLIRDELDAVVIGITGSVGKTTTKDMLYALLSPDMPVVKTSGNYNNELGLPLTMSQADENTRCLILEMGMRGMGEIQYLGEISRPHFGIITNIEPVHAELLGSLENIAKTKAEIGIHLPATGALIINEKDHTILSPYLQKCKAPIITVGFGENSDVQILEPLLMEENLTKFPLLFRGKEHIISMNLAGRQHMQNAAMAFTVACLMGISPEKLADRLEIASYSAMRFAVNTVKGVKLINDAYNANPASTGYAIESLRYVAGKRRLLVFGDMFELGEYEIPGHLKVGEKILSANLDKVYLLGNSVVHTQKYLLENGYSPDRVLLFASGEELAKAVCLDLREDDVVLFKASRGMYLEKVLRLVEECWNAD